MDYCALVRVGLGTRHYLRGHLTRRGSSPAALTQRTLALLEIERPVQWADLERVMRWRMPLLLCLTLVAVHLMGCEVLKDAALGRDENLEYHHENRGQYLLREKRFSEAIEEFKKAREYGGSEYITQVYIAKCLDGLGRYKEARAAYEKVFGDAPQWHGRNFLPLATLIAKYEGNEKAVKWIQDLRAAHPEVVETTWLLGLYHGSKGRFEEGLPYLMETFDRICKKHGFEFDDNGDLAHEDAIVGRQRNELAQLVNLLRDLSYCALMSNELDRAFRYSTIGLKLVQGFRRSDGDRPPRYVVAGDVEFRLRRAYVQMNRKEFDEAAAEIKWAKIKADRHTYPGSKRAVVKASRDLKQAKEGVGQADPGSSETPRYSGSPHP